MFPDQDRRTHLTQLDALRAIAVLGVMLHHSVPERFKGLTGYASAGGVKLFFVLSGFLITGILLKARDLVDRERETRPAALVRFYARRALRIFPLYYLVVLAGLAIDVEPVRRALVPLVTFTFNLHMVRQGWTSRTTRTSGACRWSSSSTWCGRGSCCCCRADGCCRRRC